MRLYSELASWWSLLSPPSHYVEEAADLLPRLAPAPGLTLLELGSGGGSLASHLASDFVLTLTDLSPGMLRVSRTVNPGVEHVEGDMRTLRLGRRFDRVLIHDAISYMLTEVDLLAAFVTAREHIKEDGKLVVLPDCVTETFEHETSHGGEDGDDGRGLRYLEWSWDQDHNDTVQETAYALLLKEANGEVRSVLDVHQMGLFPQATWLRLFEQAGFAAKAVRDPWREVIFEAVPK